MQATGSTLPVSAELAALLLRVVAYDPLGCGPGPISKVRLVWMLQDWIRDSQYLLRLYGKGKPAAWTRFHTACLERHKRLLREVQAMRVDEFVISFKQAS